MGRWFLRGLAAALACGLWSSVALAQDGGTLPTVQTLQCGTACGNATEPRALNRHDAGSYPGFSPQNYPTEGLVVVQATIAKEGTLRDAKVIHLIGAQVFADKVLEACKDWRYQPATRGGIPVDRPNWEIIVTFMYDNDQPGARPDVYHKFREASRLAEDGKRNEAIEVLLPILSLPHLSFYEREAVSLQLAIQYVNLGDALTAREYLDDVHLIGDSFLPPEMRATLWRVIALTNAGTGQRLEAQAAYAKLNAIKSVAADDPITKVMQTVDAQIRGGKVLGTSGRISKIGALPMWQHRMTRHNVGFQNVEGRLDRIVIDCGEHTIASAFSDKAEWHIPKNWETCRIAVEGERGATFMLVETDE